MVSDRETAVLEMKRILTELTTKIRITACLPSVLQREVSNKVLAKSKVTSIREISDYYESVWGATRDTSDTKKIEGNGKSVEKKLKEIIESLAKHPAVEEFIKDSQTYVSPSMKEFVSNIERYANFAWMQISTTPEEEKSYKMILRDCEYKLKKAEKKLEYLQGLLLEEKMKFEEFAGNISAEIEKNESLIEEMRNEANKRISKKMEESRAEMLAVNAKALQKRKILEEQINLMDEELQRTIEKNKIRESQLREIRLDAQKRYVQLLAKYDTDLSASEDSLQKLKEELRALTEEQNDLENRLIEQRIVYAQLKEEQRNARMKAFLEQLVEFRRTRAAKIIQRAWRMYRERVLSKKKKRSKKRANITSSAISA